MALDAAKAMTYLHAHMCTLFYQACPAAADSQALMTVKCHTATMHK